MMKIKVAFGNDMRLFKYEGASLSEAYDTLTTFVLNTFEVQDFRLQYRDDEDDLITVTTADELDEAFDFAMEQGKTLKLFVVAVAAQPTTTVHQQQDVAVEDVAPATEEKADVPPEFVTEVEQPQEDVGSTDAIEEEDNPEEKIRDLVKLLVEDEGFRQEFAAFAQDVVLQLREDDGFETAVQTALAAHEDLAAHPFVRDHFLKILPFIAVKAEFAVPYLKSMEPTVIPSMIEHAVEGIREGQHMMPFLACMMGGAGNGGCPFGPAANGAPQTMGPFGGFGGMPFFGGGFGPHGGSHGSPMAGQGCPSNPGFRRGGCGFRGRGHHGFGRRCGRRGQATERGGRCGKKANRAYRADIVDPNVTLEDKALVLPNSSVVKTWRIRNTGEEAFPEGTKLKYVGKPFNKLVDGVEFPVESIPVGEEGEVSVLLTTPGEAGRFGSAWRLQLPDGTPFGQMFRARVQVVSDVLAGESSSDSDDMADIYDTATPQDKKARKLEKMMAKKAKLEARLAKLGSKIEDTRSSLEQAPDDAPIVSTLPATTAGGDFKELDDGEDVVDANVNTDAEVDMDDVPVVGDEFGNELAALQNMGFSNLELNRMLLHEHNGQMDAVINTLCELKA